MKKIGYVVAREKAGCAIWYSLCKKEKNTLTMLTQRVYCNLSNMVRIKVSQTEHMTLPRELKSLWMPA